MSQFIEEIAKDLVAAWLSQNAMAFESPEKTGEMITAIYTATVQAIKKEQEQRHRAAEQQDGWPPELKWVG